MPSGNPSISADDLETSFFWGGLLALPPAIIKNGIPIVSLTLLSIGEPEPLLAGFFGAVLVTGITIVPVIMRVRMFLFHRV